MYDSFSNLIMNPRELTGPALQYGRLSQMRFSHANMNHAVNNAHMSTHNISLGWANEFKVSPGQDDISMIDWHLDTRL